MFTYSFLWVRTEKDECYVGHSIVVFQYILLYIHQSPSTQLITTFYETNYMATCFEPQEVIFRQLTFWRRNYIFLF